MNVTRYVTGESRQTCANLSDPTRTVPTYKYSTSLRAAQNRLGRILTGTFGTIDEAAS